VAATVVEACLGLVAGSGSLPLLVARGARAQAGRLVVLALAEAGRFESLAHRVVPCQVGEIGPMLGVLAEEGIRQVVFAGRVPKEGLFHGASLDAAARGLVARSRDWTDEGLLEAAAQALAGLGIELLDQRRFLAPWLAPEGHLAGPRAPAAVAADIARGAEVARAVARYGIGQTVVVRAGVVAAVEGMEGTDETIRRGLRLAGPGGTVVKAPRPGHDYRFDVPTVGEVTLGMCAEGQAAALALEAGRVALVERDRVTALADTAGISVVGLSGTGALG
jgi:DUF1009 family protein